MENGDLLVAAERAGFKALVTKDTNIPFQQNLSGRDISLLILRPQSQQEEDLLALAPAILVALSNLEPGNVVRVAPE